MWLARVLRNGVSSDGGSPCVERPQHRVLVLLAGNYQYQMSCSWAATNYWPVFAMPLGCACLSESLTLAPPSWLFTVTMQVYIQGENKPYQKMLDAGCNTWRVSSDVLCRWDGMSGGVAGIIDYWGDHAKSMQPFAGPTKGWHDPVS